MTWAQAAPDWRAAWTGCPRGDWLLAIAARAGVERSLLIEAAADCAHTALEFLRDEPRPAQAIEAARAHAGGAADVDLRARFDAAEAAAEAAQAAGDMASASASRAAAFATRVGEDPFAAAASASHAVEAAVAATGDCAMMQVLTYTHDRCADLVRARIPIDTLLAALES